MNHTTTAGYWVRYNVLPADIRGLADRNFSLLKRDPRHPSLHFKNLKGPLWSVRVGISYRAVALEKPDAMNWFWIGHHADYDRLIR